MNSQYLKTAPNRTVRFPVFENRIEPHRRIYFIKNEPHRRITINVNRTEPHRKISDFLKPHRNRVSRKIHRNAKKMRWILLSPGTMFGEVATLVHRIESSKPAARKQAVRRIVPLKVPRPLAGLERRPFLAVVRELAFWRVQALHDMKIDSDFVLISAMMTVTRLCRLDP